jgi:hypothetical protein
MRLWAWGGGGGGVFLALEDSAGSGELLAPPGPGGLSVPGCSLAVGGSGFLAPSRESLAPLGSWGSGTSGMFLAEFGLGGCLVLAVSSLLVEFGATVFVSMFCGVLRKAWLSIVYW